MYKLRHYVCKKIIISIYFSLIYPFLIYAIPIWGASDNIYIKPFLILQKRIGRLLTFNDIPPLIRTKGTTKCFTNDLSNSFVTCYKNE